MFMMNLLAVYVIIDHNYETLKNHNPKKHIMLIYARYGVYGETLNEF